LAVGVLLLGTRVRDLGNRYRLAPRESTVGQPASTRAQECSKRSHGHTPASGIRIQATIELKVGERDRSARELWIDGRSLRLTGERVATLCRAVCTQVAIELDNESQVPPADRLLPAMRR